MKEEKEQKCIKLIYTRQDNEITPCVILGLIVEESNDFLTFKTAKRVYKISKKRIISQETTNEPFYEVVGK